MWGGGIFLTGPDGKTREVYCLDAGSGKLLWGGKVVNVSGRAGAPSKVWQDASYAAPPPVTDARLVGALSGGGDLACLDNEGKLVWSRRLGAPRLHPGRGKEGCGDRAVFRQMTVKSLWR